ncbi:MAG TPA: hypothetical protein VFY35_05315 [Burkholderiaceae bacterium]|nr:hypothetical protein [Burkholderiaceae bacterium]
MAQLVLGSCISLALVACGGGESPQAMDTPTQTNNPAVPSTTPQSAIHLPLTELGTRDDSTPTPGPLSPLQAKGQTHFVMATPLPATLLNHKAVAQAETMTMASGADISASTQAGSVTSGTSAADIAAPLAQCASIDLNTVYTSTTAAAGGNSCYQFVINAKSKIDVQVALPSGITGSAYLYYVEPSTGQLTTVLDTAQSPTPLLLNQVVGQYARVVLAVVPSTGTGGQAFQLAAFNRPNFDTYEANDKVSRPTAIEANKAVTGNIDVPGIDQDHYFIPFGVGETQANLKFTFTANQSVGIRLAQQTGPNSYAFSSTETPISAASSGQNLLLTLPVPANTAGSTTPYGLIVRVGGTSATAPAAEGYSIRVSARSAWASAFGLSNTENISRWFPRSGYLQAANYVGITAKVTSHSGNTIPDQPVVVRVFPDKGDRTAYQEYNLVTDVFGQIYLKAYLPSCSSNHLYYGTNYGAYGSSIRWNGSAQYADVHLILPDTTPNPADSTSPIYLREFTRICSETLVTQ